VDSTSTKRVRKRSRGNPASRKTSSMASAQPPTLGACFRSPAFPAMRPGAANRKTCQKGKFHGMIASTTPRGRKETKLSRASVSTGSRASWSAPFSA